MRLHLYGGFGEKGRTCLGVEVDGYRLLLDAGVKTSARGADYYPAITADELRATDAIVITHAHEDHVAALGWCIAGGFRGRLLMTAGTGREVDLFLEAYADASHRRAARKFAREDLPVGATIALGPLQLIAGRSGHVSGGVWCTVADGRHTLGYCGDVVPASEVFGRSAAALRRVVRRPYGDDDVTAQRAKDARLGARARPGLRAADAAQWALGGAAGDRAGAIALSQGMRQALQLQIADPAWLAEGGGRAAAAAGIGPTGRWARAAARRADLPRWDGHRRPLARSLRPPQPLPNQCFSPATCPPTARERMLAAGRRRGCGCRRIRPCPRTPRSSRTARRKPSSVIRARRAALDRLNGTFTARADLGPATSSSSDERVSCAFSSATMTASRHPASLIWPAPPQHSTLTCGTSPPSANGRPQAINCRSIRIFCCRVSASAPTPARDRRPTASSPR
jgi:glyoxylase-like metal-dependent hydrolase (beta-lactamase superfamily II)